MKWAYWALLAGFVPLVVAVVYYQNDGTVPSQIGMKPFSVSYLLTFRAQDIIYEGLGTGRGLTQSDKVELSGQRISATFYALNRGLDAVQSRSP